MTGRGPTLCVFCGSRAGALPAFTTSARAIGAGLARRSWQLVYGGGRVGLMGEVADAAILMLPGTMFQPAGSPDGTRQLRIAFANIDRTGVARLFDRLDGLIL